MSQSADRLPTSAQPGVDLTALAWCLGEIRNSLEQALYSLATSLAPNPPTDPSPARAAVNWIHQAVGALRFVRLDEVARVLQQIERIATAIDRNERSLDAEALAVIERAVAGVLEWLEVAARGTPVSAVGLFAQYRELLQLRGADRIEPSDLFEARLIRGAPGDLVLQPLSVSHASAVQTSALGPWLAQAQSVLKRRSAVFVVSDFISPSSWEKPLAQLARRHEVVAVRLRDPLEMAWPDNTGMLLVQDAESGEQLLVDGNDAAFRARFAQQAQDREAALLESLSQAGVDCLELNTDEAMDQALLRFAQLRKRASQLSTGGPADPLGQQQPLQAGGVHA